MAVPPSAAPAPVSVRPALGPTSEGTGRTGAGGRSRAPSTELSSCCRRASAACSSGRTRFTAGDIWPRRLRSAHGPPRGCRSSPDVLVLPLLGVAGAARAPDARPGLARRPQLPEWRPSRRAHAGGRHPVRRGPVAAMINCHRAAGRQSLRHPGARLRPIEAPTSVIRGRVTVPWVPNRPGLTAPTCRTRTASSDRPTRRTGGTKTSRGASPGCWPTFFTPVRSTGIR